LNIAVDGECKMTFKIEGVLLCNKQTLYCVICAMDVSKARGIKLIDLRDVCKDQLAWYRSHMNQTMVEVGVTHNPLPIVNVPGERLAKD